MDINENSPVEEALLRLKLLKAGKPTNGAVLLFAKDPQRRFIQSEVFSITDRTARNDLKSLRDKKILIQRGTSKKLTYYELSV